MKTKKEIVEQMLKEGATEFTRTITAISTYKDEKGRNKFCISLDKPVAGYKADDNGDFEEGEVYTIHVFVSNFVAIMAETDGMNRLSGHIKRNPEDANLIFPGVKVKGLCEPVQKSNPDDPEDRYTNPWVDDAEPTLVKHDNIFHHLVSMMPSDDDKKFVRDLIVSLIKR